MPLTPAFAQEKEPDKPAQSVVRGRVRFADSEQPLRRATVRLRKEFNLAFRWRSISNKHGEFSFQEVPAGTYYIDVEAPGIVSFNNGVTFTDLGFGVDVTNLQTVIVDGTNEVKTDLRVKRGGVITGRVSYSDGEPATRARIVLYRQTGKTASLFVVAHAFRTDDRGVYRIEGLPSGQYFVGAVENHSGGGNTYPRNSPGLVTAYHPSAGNLSAATAVSVEAGSETREVNIKFVDELRRISGTIKWKHNSTPVNRASVSLHRVGDPRVELDYLRFSEMVTPPSADNVDRMMSDVAFLGLLSTNLPFIEIDNGRWSFVDLPAGTYRIAVEGRIPPNEAAKPQKSNDPYADMEDLDNPETKQVRGFAEVTVKDRDVDNLSIELSQGGSIAGTVVIEGTSAAARVGIRLSTATGGLIPLFDLAERVKEDRTFVINGVPAGNTRLDIGQSTYFYVRSITGKGMNLLNEPLTLIDGEQVNGIQIVLGTDLATVEGRVIAASGGVAGAGVVLLPVDQRKWALRSLWGLARADADGRFSMRVAPGEYVALAWSLGNEPAGSIESHVQANLAATRRVTFQSNEKKSIELQVSTKPVGQP